MSKSDSKRTKISYAMRENLEFALLFIMGIVMIVVGMALLWFGHDIEFMIAAGIGFAVASYVGIRMMVGTREVAHKLYERFNDQNTILSSHTDTLKEIVQIYEKIDQRAEKRAEEFKKEMAEIYEKIDQRAEKRAEEFKKEMAKMDQRAEKRAEEFKKEMAEIYEKIDQRAEKRAEEFKKEMAEIHAKIVDTRKDTMASLEYIMKRLER